MFPRKSSSLLHKPPASFSHPTRQRQPNARLHRFHRRPTLLWHVWFPEAIHSFKQLSLDRVQGVKLCFPAPRSQNLINPDVAKHRTFNERQSSQKCNSLFYAGIAGRFRRSALLTCTLRFDALGKCLALCDALRNVTSMSACYDGCELWDPHRTNCRSVCFQSLLKLLSPILRKLVPGF